MPDPSSLVLVLTAPEEAPCLNATLTDTITRIIAKDAIIASRWLATGEAWELISRFVFRSLPAQADRVGSLSRRSRGGSAPQFKPGRRPNTELPQRLYGGRGGSAAGPRTWVGRVDPGAPGSWRGGMSDPK